jgi:hypothetical protein
VLSPPLPGAGKRVLTPDAMREFWYQRFHQLPLIEQILDGDPVAVRAYLAHFWNHWSGPDFTPTDARLDHLAAAYGEPGAMTATIGWYRADAEHDPLFTRAWSDRLDVFFADVELIGSTAPATSRRSRPRRHSRRRSASGASSRSPAARRGRSRCGPSAPPSPPGDRAR